MSDQGEKFDSEKIMLQLFPPEALFEIGAVLTYGAKKYAPRNWEKGIEYSRVYGGPTTASMGLVGRRRKRPREWLTALGSCRMLPRIPPGL